MKNGQGRCDLLCNFVNLEDNCLSCTFFLIQSEGRICAFMTDQMQNVTVTYEGFISSRCLFVRDNSPMPDQQDFCSIVSLLNFYLLPHQLCALILQMVLTHFYCRD